MTVEELKKQFQSIILGVDENDQHAYLEDEEANECVAIAEAYANHVKKDLLEKMLENPHVINSNSIKHMINVIEAEINSVKKK